MHPRSSSNTTLRAQVHEPFSGEREKNTGRSDTLFCERPLSYSAGDLSCLDKLVSQLVGRSVGRRSVGALGRSLAQPTRNACEARQPNNLLDVAEKKKETEREREKERKKMTRRTKKDLRLREEQFTQNTAVAHTARRWSPRSARTFQSDTHGSKSGTAQMDCLCTVLCIFLWTSSRVAARLSDLNAVIPGIRTAGP